VRDIWLRTLPSGHLLPQVVQDVHIYRIFDTMRIHGAGKYYEREEKSKESPSLQGRDQRAHLQHIATPPVRDTSGSDLDRKGLETKPAWSGKLQPREQESEV